MKRLLVVLCLLVGSSFLAAVHAGPSAEGQGADKKKKAEKPKKAPPGKLSENQIKDRIIAESKANYPENYPCDEDTDAAGRRCGGHSAHSRAGGYSPICYRSEVTAEKVSEYRDAHPKQTAEAEKTAN